MSILDIYNTQAIADNRTELQTIQLMQETEQKADALKQRFKMDVPNYIEFRDQHPPSTPNIPVGNVLGGAGLGALTGAIASVVIGDDVSELLVGGGALTGGIIGGMSAEGAVDMKLQNLKDYSQFLNNTALKAKTAEQPRNVVSEPAGRAMMAQDNGVNKER